MCYMNKMELLAPAGDMESLKMAIANGADAVYLGIKQFNARNNIQGFNLDTLLQAVDFAHLFDVKVYLALNILFKDGELQQALDVVVEANNMGVDAFIVQDLGLIGLIRKYYPNIELHASTQMAVHNLEGVRVLEKLGFKRVVLARETSMSEIKRITDNSDIKVEFFVQGALCVSFSGNCYMCSHLVDKSGNRGLCQQFCRLPYTFECENVKKKGFLLSTKDICMLDEIETLRKLNVSSLKIEGRARRPFYVAKACKIYREALDKASYQSADFDMLKIAFNRGYTPAYFKGNGNIISKIQGNNGLEIGVVKQVKNGKKFNEIFISTNYDLKPKSGLKFIYQGKEIASIGAHDIKHCGELYRVTTTSVIKVGSKVCLIQDQALEQELLKHHCKLDIKMFCEVKISEPLKLIAKYKDIEVCVESDFVCEQAKTISVNKQGLLVQLSRSEYFNIVDFEAVLDDVYILNSSINKLRNDLYEKLKCAILSKYTKQKINKVLLQSINKKPIHSLNFKIINKLNVKEDCRCLIFDYDNFDEQILAEFDAYCKSNNIEGYIDLPNFATAADIKRIKSLLDKSKLGVVANNLYALSWDVKMLGGQFLNIYNSYALQTLQLLHDLEGAFVEEVEPSDINSEVPVLKREKVYMTLLHCPFKQNIGGDCNNCKFVKNSTFTINSGKSFAVTRKKTATCIFLLKDWRG